MSYNIRKLAKTAGISVRTLHYYDEIGLLRPSRVKRNSYRSYDENDLLQLQQILFFRELDFPLGDIKRIISSPSFDMKRALGDHKRLIELKRERLGRLIKTIDKTIKKINKENNMGDEELYGNFSKEEMERYSQEAKERWGQTEAYKQSEERVKKMGKEGLKRVLKDAGQLTEEIARAMQDGKAPTSKQTQELIAKHYDWLRAFYEPNYEIYRGLAEMYVADPRFKRNYEDVAGGLAEYMRSAMLYYADQNEKKS